MKKLNYLLLAAAIGLLAPSCQHPGGSSDDPLPEGTTYLSISVQFPRGSGNNTRLYNDKDSVAGVQEVNSLEVYLLSADGQTMEFAKRYLKSADEITWSTNGKGYDVLSTSAPIKTTPGDKQIFVIVNNPLPTPFTSKPDPNYTFSLAVTPLNMLAKVDTDYAGGSLADTIFKDKSVTMDIFPDLLTMSGQYPGTFTVADNVSLAEAAAGDGNQVPLNLVRVPSRVIVTTSAGPFPAEVKDNGTVIGTIEQVTYSVAQGSNSVYLFGQNVAGVTTDVNTPGYAYKPGTDYLLTSPTYYDYTDLSVTTDTVPFKPTGENLKALMYMPGKFLLENTHATGTDISNSGYKQGNTAYVLVRAKFTPAAFTDSGTAPADGTFYVGAGNRRIYTSIDAARTPADGGEANQDVMTYTGGKVLYYIWLNPDVIAKPVNSPVVRNNIYHIDITGFSSFGYNWNPLDPSPGGTNPDPQPTDPTEPVSPIDPTDPLSSTDTYIKVNATILPWATHSYDIDL